MIPKGATGASPTFEVGTVSKLAPEATPVVKLDKTDTGYKISLGIPQGAMGPAPKKGIDYWNDKDKQDVYAEAKEYVDKAILEGKW